MREMIERGALHPLTLTFRDGELEGRFQSEEGAAGRAGYRIITGTTALMWVLAAILIPLGSGIAVQTATVAGGSMAVVGLLALAASKWASTMDRQHLLASLLTSANGLVILILASAGDFIEGYAVGAIMLLFLFGSVSRTRFVFAMLRTAVIAVGLGVVISIHDRPSRLILDAFFFVGAAVGSLVGLRMLEGNRRRLWHQGLIVEDQRAAIEFERAESERLLLNVLPEAVSKRLRHGENPIADDFTDVTVLFADIVGFTPIASNLTAVEVVTMLNGLFSRFDELVAERGLEKIKTIGDAYMAVGGLPEAQEDHALRVVDLALAIQRCTMESGHFGDMSIRIGVHSGPVAGGVIGTHKFAYDVWGNTVNVASRLENAGIPGRVHVSDVTKTLTESHFEYDPRGVMELRGVGPTTTYLLVGPKHPGVTIARSTNEDPSQMSSLGPERL
jgi:class 3 adenylate cyclase